MFNVVPFPEDEMLRLEGDYSDFKGNIKKIWTNDRYGVTMTIEGSVRCPNYITRVTLFGVPGTFGSLEELREYCTQHAGVNL